MHIFESVLLFASLFFNLHCVPSFSDIKGVASASDIPDYLLPVAETKITQCSTFVVVCRLKSYKYTVTSEGSDLWLPEYPFVRIVIPKNAIQKAEELQVTVKVSIRRIIHMREYEIAIQCQTPSNMAEFRKHLRNQVKRMRLPITRTFKGIPGRFELSGMGLLWTPPLISILTGRTN